MGIPSNTMKRARSEGNRSLVLLVPPAAVALVIGKGGSTIKEIQQNSTANVTFEKQDTFLQGAPHRRVTITSGRWSANIAAQAAILRIIQSVDSVVATQAGTVTLRLLVPNGSCSLLIGKKGVQINQIGISSGPDTTVHMLIPSSQVGRAIGKGGSVIKQVSALCGNSVQIQIEKDDHAAATNKMGVPMRQIGATAPSVELAHKALGLLLTTVHNHEPESNWTMICVPVATQDL